MGAPPYSAREDMYYPANVCTLLNVILVWHVSSGGVCILFVFYLYVEDEPCEPCCRRDSIWRCTKNEKVGITDLNLST